MTEIVAEGADERVVLVPERFIVGVDLGQTRDFTAIVVSELSVGHQRETYAPPRATAFEPSPQLRERRRRWCQHAVRAIHRPPLGTPYTDVAALVQRAVNQLPPLPKPPTVVLDNSGVGRPVSDMLRANGLAHLPVTIVGGTLGARRSADGRGWSVSKFELVSVLDATLGETRLLISPALALAPVLTDELRDFSFKTRASAATSFEAAAGQHDDLVLATALAVWHGERPTGQPARWVEDPSPRYR